MSMFIPLTLDTYFDKIFYINLAKDVERNEHMIAQFQKFRIRNYERIEAVGSAALPGEERYRNFNKRDHKYITGQLACAASQLLCVKTAKQRNYSKVLILEDDAYMLDDPNVLLANNRAILNDWDMLYFGGLIEPHFDNQIVCTHAYAIRNIIFDDIINMADASGMEIDNFYAKILHHMSYNYNDSGKYNIRIIQPFNRIIQNKLFASNIL